MLRKELPVDICNKILSTNHKNNMERTKKLLNLNNFLNNNVYYVNVCSRIAVDVFGLHLKESDASDSFFIRNDKLIV